MYVFKNRSSKKNGSFLTISSQSATRIPTLCIDIAPHPEISIQNSMMFAAAIQEDTKHYSLLARATCSTSSYGPTSFARVA